MRAHLCERGACRGLEWMAGEHRVEAVLERRMRDRPRHELQKVEPVTRERLDCTVKRAGPVVGHEREGRPPVVALTVDARRVRYRDEQCELFGMVAHVS